MSRNLHLKGQKFGKLTVIGPSDKKLGTSFKWECQCDCGNISFSTPASLKSGGTKSCGCAMSPDLTGKKYNMLTVLKKIGKHKNNSFLWLCECECGQQATISTSRLKSAKNCGINCLIKLKIAPMKAFYNTYKSTAKLYSREFDLTLEQFINIASKPCVYCGFEGVDKGIPLRKNRETARTNRNMKAKINIEDFHYIANGIDRVDSSIGYRIDNCVPCCRPCNVAKMNRTAAEFLDHANRIVDYQKNKKD